MTDQCDIPKDLDRLFDSQEQTTAARSGQDPVRLLEARIAQLERQQRVFEEAHQQIVAQNLETSDALLTEQRTALARLEQEVAARTKGWREKVAALERAKGALEGELLTSRQHLLTFVYAVDAKTKIILEATAILSRDIHTRKGIEALKSIRSSAAALLNISDPYCGRGVRGNGTDDDDPDAAHEGDGSPADSVRPFDLDVALTRAGGDKGLLKELVTLFLTDGPKRLLEARAALDKGDGPALGLAAHTLKGAAGLFGAGEVTRIASELEQLRRAGDLGHAKRVCADLEAALTRLLHALRGCMEEFGEDARD